MKRMHGGKGLPGVWLADVVPMNTRRNIPEIAPITFFVCFLFCFVFCFKSGVLGHTNLSNGPAKRMKPRCRELHGNQLIYCHVSHASTVDRRISARLRSRRLTDSAGRDEIKARVAYAEFS